MVIAIGNFYNLVQTITKGIISAPAASVLTRPGGKISYKPTPPLTTVNSDGTLINALDELVSINTLSFDMSNNGETPKGIGFAISTALTTKVINNNLILDGLSDPLLC